MVTGLCRLLGRRGVSVAPFKGQNMALNAAVTADGGEIGHAQWVQALAAGAEPEVAMNPVLLKPTSEHTSQVVVMGAVVGEQSARDYHDGKDGLRRVVLDALADLRRRYDVVICEGAGGAAEINLLARDLANVPLAAAAGLPAVVVGDIDRGGVFASLLGTVSLLPDDLRPWVRGFVINRFRGDPSLLGDATGELERRTGVPTLGVVPMVPGTDLDAEDSLALDRWDTGSSLSVVDVAAIRFPHVANFGDLDPLRLEPAVAVRWVRSAAALGRPDLVVLPGSKSTRADLDWFKASGLAAAVGASGAAVVGICAGAQMVGSTIADPDGVEGPPGVVDGLGWLPLRTVFEGAKVLDRPSGVAVGGGPGAGERVAGYRIHNGRVTAGAVEPWLVADDGTHLGWCVGRVCGTTLHGLFEADGLRAAILRWATGAALPQLPGVSFADARQARFDRIADVLEASLDLDRLFALIEEGAPDVLLAKVPSITPIGAGRNPLGGVTALVPHLRWRAGPPADGDLLGSMLAADPDLLAAEIAGTAAGRGSDDPAVLASLWWQAYCYRLAGTTLAAWVVSGAAPDPAAPGTGVGLARSRPSSLLVDPGAAMIDDLDRLVTRLFDDHLDPVAASLRARHAVGTRLLHGNTAAAVASALGAVGTAEGAPDGLRDRVDRATAAIARPDEPDLGAWTGWDYRRTTCCLWFKTTAAKGAMCEDCSLRPDPAPQPHRTGDTEPRQARLSVTSSPIPPDPQRTGDTEPRQARLRVTGSPPSGEPAS
jgi:adenosylcobyric acid synthase